MDRQTAAETVAQNTPTATRRRVLGVLAAGAAGAVGLHASTRESRATATLATDGLTVPDDAWDAPDNQIYSPVVSVDATWSFEGADTAASVMVALLIDGTLITTTTADVTAPSGSGTATLAGDVVDSRQWSESDWQPADGGEVTHAVNAEIRLEVRDSSGNTLAKAAAASDGASITVRDGGPTTSSSLSGSGDVKFKDSQSATPTG